LETHYNKGEKMIQLLKILMNDLQKEGRYIEIHLEENTTSYISLTSKEVESISHNSFLMGNIRFFEKGYWSFFSFNGDNEKKILAQVKQMASLMTHLKDQKETLIMGEVHKDHIVTPYLENPQKMDIKQKYDFINHYREIMLKEGKDKLANTKTIYKDQLRKTTFYNSQGSEITQEKQLTGAAFYAIAKDKNNIQQGGLSKAAYGGLEVIKGLEQEIKGAVETSIELLKAPALEKGSYDVILDNQMTGVFAHEAFGHLSEADFAQDNKALQDMMAKGRLMGAKELNIIDDGSLSSLVGYTPYDDEGTKAKTNYLIKEGKLVGRLHSKETANKMGEPLTGNARALNALYAPLVRMTNTFIDKGNTSKEEMFDRVKDGIYCCNFIGGMTNLEKFTFTPAKSYRIKNGKIVGLCKDVMLSGNTFETLHQIKAVGDDLMHFGTLGGCGKGGQNGLPVTIGGPHILLNQILVG
jgi:TldD protein